MDICLQHFNKESYETNHFDLLFYHKSLHEKIQNIERIDITTEHLLLEDKSISRDVLRKEETHATQCSCYANKQLLHLAMA